MELVERWNLSLKALFGVDLSGSTMVPLRSAPVEPAQEKAGGSTGKSGQWDRGGTTQRQ
ncbi:hypothetical protein OL229_10755 [Neisseriaceae bacterium JH1-16]|nr:hypothetical protein [Neisseriaceae bacterium JH1-16]